MYFWFSVGLRPGNAYVTPSAFAGVGLSWHLRDTTTFITLFCSSSHTLEYQMSFESCHQMSLASYWPFIFMMSSFLVLFLCSFIFYHFLSVFAFCHFLEFHLLYVPFGLYFGVISPSLCAISSLFCNQVWPPFLICFALFY